MFRKLDGQPNFDAVMCVAGEFAFSPGVEQLPQVELTMAYANSETRVTYGTCPVKTPLLSQKTREALLAFVHSAEEDFGEVVFGSGAIASWEGSTKGQEAETEQGLQKVPTAFPRGLGEQ